MRRACEDTPHPINSSGGFSLIRRHFQPSGSFFSHPPHQSGSNFAVELAKRRQKANRQTARRNHHARNHEPHGNTSEFCAGAREAQADRRRKRRHRAEQAHNATELFGRNALLHHARSGPLYIDSTTPEIAVSTANQKNMLGERRPVAIRIMPENVPENATTRNKRLPPPHINRMAMRQARTRHICPR